MCWWNASSQNLNWLEAYQVVCEEWKIRESAEAFLEFTNTADPTGLSPAEVSGFHAAAVLIDANHGWNPLEQWITFVAWRDTLEGAIAREPDSPNLRLIRFGVQTNAPLFLGYSGHKAQDHARCTEAAREGYWKAYPEFQNFVLRTLNQGL